MRIILILVVFAAFAAWGYGAGQAFGLCQAGVTLPATVDRASMAGQLPALDVPVIGDLMLMGFSSGKSWFCG